MKKINLFKNRFSKGFTLMEILIVILIMGILVAIAVPKYERILYKVRLHRGVSLVESLYQAQQAYFLANGKYAEDIDQLDISLPLNSSCVKTQNKSLSRYKCDFGTIGIMDGKSNIEYQAKPSYNAYVHTYKKYKHPTIGNMLPGERFCFASTRETHPSQQSCLEMGGGKIKADSNWTYYRVK